MADKGSKTRKSKTAKQNPKKKKGLIGVITGEKP
jgi:hypothetical protein